MLVIGLTGGIGMGKSAAAEHFARAGVPVFNADACVHRLYEGEAVEPSRRNFPGWRAGAASTGSCSPNRWRDRPSASEQLEEIVHPMVVEAEIEFLREQEEKGANLPCSRSRSCSRPAPRPAST